MKKVKSQLTIAACIRANERNIKRFTSGHHLSFATILDFGCVTDSIGITHTLRDHAVSNISTDHCLRLMIVDPTVLERLNANLPSLRFKRIILSVPMEQSQRAITAARKLAEEVFVEIYSDEMAFKLRQYHPDGFVIRGNEAGGISSNMSNPTIFRKIKAKVSEPIWIYGGIGAQSALAYAIGGARGVILSDALSLMPELVDNLNEHDTRSLKSGVRTQSIDIGNRMHIRVSEAYPAVIQEIRNLCIDHDRQLFETKAQGDSACRSFNSIIEQYDFTNCFMGEEIAWASQWSKQFDSVSSLIKYLKENIIDQLEILRNDFPLAKDNALAKELNAKYPILQGPMTHVSDVPDFLANVAQNGAVPFAALGTNSGEQIEQLMAQTHEKISGSPWGVGIIGFAPKAVQDEQLEVIRKYKPNMAIVAGGRPQHYKTLKDMGIMPFLHIPVPSMIGNFYKEGVRHFIFEGRGCGGHIGPINSYTLWQSALIEFEQLAEAGHDLSDVRIAFAGGIFDAVSSAMTSAFCTPLLPLGVQFCVIVGTAYLFTQEIVQSDAISPVFQKVALGCGNTVVMEGAAGHALRCAHTPLISEYARKRVELINDGLPTAEVQLELENINIGRLRLASKGTKLKGVVDGKIEIVTLSEEDQEKEGLYMIGEVATLMDQTITMDDLHRNICNDPAWVIDARAPIALDAIHIEKPAIDVKSTDIAIIGLSTMVPGAENLDDFWHNILAKVYCITDVPEHRWNPDINYHPDPNNKDTCYSKMGGFLGEIPINCMAYGIPPGSMKSVDPAQLLALEAVRCAIKDAGYEKREFDRSKASVIFGYAGGGDQALGYSVRAALKEYMHRANDIPDDIREKIIESVNEVLPEWTEDSFPGFLGNIIAGRVANRFNLNGLNFTLDAACASSMAALKVACQELVYGTTETAIVGGVDASLHTLGFTCFSKTKALSLSDESKPFSHDADGIILGEGVGVMILKRLDDAIKDNDHIYAVVKGIGGSSDGKGSGMTVPVQKGQEMAVNRAYDVAGFKLDTVDLVEAHGTGTPLGDRVELVALNKLLQDHGATQPFAVGSVKSAIGHTKGAAGILGVIKATLALYHKVLPAHVNVQKVHKAISNPNTKLYLNTKTRPWFRRVENMPRRAGASAFGFGGTNFHVVLEESPYALNHGAKLPSDIWPTELFLFSAKDTKTLVKRIDITLKSLDKSEATLTQLAHTHYSNQLPSGAAPIRLAIKANSISQLKDKLLKSKSLIQDGKIQTDAAGKPKSLLLGEGIWGACIESLPGPLTALFPGQGAQKLDMLKDLALTFPVVRECLENSNAILETDFFPASKGVLTDYIYPPTIEKQDAEKEAMAALTQTTVAQPALGAVEMALYRLLRQFNVKIEMAAGHSFGELTALWAAGVLTDRQLLTLAGTRGRCMAGSSDVATGMTAVQTNRETLREYVDGVEELSIANHNTPKQVVVSGSIAALEQFESWCKEQKLGFKRLPVSQGFHSPFMEAAANQWQAALSTENFLPANMLVFSNMTAKPYGDTSESITETLGKHLRNGVNFVDEIEGMYDAGARAFIEIGPGATLTNFLGAILGDKPHYAIATQPRQGKSGVEMLQDCLATLFACGYDVDLKPAYSYRKIAQKTLQPEPSPTLFMVSGAGARPTVPFKTKQPSVPKPSRWANQTTTTPKPSPLATKPTEASVSANNSTRPTVTSAPQSEAALNPLPPSGIPSGAVPGQNGPMAASFLSDQEKLKKMKYFQQSMNLFLEAQERLQKQRIEMMDKMWQINQNLFQGLFGQNPTVPMPTATDFSAPRPNEMATAQTLANQMAAMQAAAFTPPAAPNQQATPPTAQPVTAEPECSVPTQVKPVKPIEKTVKAESLDYKNLLFDIISERTQYPVDMLAPEQEIEADLGIDSIKRVEIISQLQEAHPSLSDVANEKYFEDMAQLKTLGDIVNWLEDKFGGSVAAAVAGQPVIQETAVAQPAAGQADYQGLLFEVVSDRTQYPVDMLSPDQEIEGDLGIDSIKRVEIISMLEQAHPSLADISNEKYFEDMAQLKTLGDIVNWLQTKFGGNIAVAANIGQPVVQQTVAAQPAGGQADYQSLLFGVVSDRTQYPVDMLSPDQEIEGDLGIDSIKRVEIISMLEQAHPSLADISNEKYFEDMAQLKTLGDIVNWLKNKFGGNIAVAAAGQPVVQQTVAAQPAPAAGQADYQSLLFQVVSDRTQYPVDMLSPEQEIEGDLGIDSIKRVEIISMLEQAHPSLADISNEKYFEDMAQLKTLGDIVNWLQAKFGGNVPVAADAGQPVVQQTVTDQPAVVQVDYQGLLFQVVSDRTQYPVDMLSPDQEIEGDLGIDSIKRVEIISMLEQAHPSLADISNEKYFEDMAQLKTLGDIINWLKNKFGAPLPSETPKLEQPPKPATATQQGGTVDFQTLLFEVISERTQYPVDMLSPEQEIEADLGIDSIKRVEIISQLQNAHPSLAEIGDEKYFEDMAQLKTLGQIVAWIETLGAGTISTKEHAANTAKETTTAVEPDTANFHRILLKLVERPLDSSTQHPVNGVLMILDGGHPVSAQVQNDAEKMGIQSIRISCGTNNTQQSNGCIVLDSVDETQCQNCYQQIKEKYGLPGGVLNMLALGKDNHDDGYEALVHSFYWAKTIGADKALLPYDQRKFFWISLSGMGGDFGLHHTMDFEACQNGPHGITKSLFHEWPGLRAKTVDILATGDPKQLSSAIINECLEPNTAPKEVGLQNGIRFETALVKQPIEHVEEKPGRFGSESVFLITGGAKGITSDVAKLLAKSYAPIIILTGRTPMPQRSSEEMEAFFAQAASAEQDPRQFKSNIIQEFKSRGEKVSPSEINARFNAIMNEYKARQNIAAMEQHNAKVFYHACDCTDDAAFSELIRQIYKEHGKINGVIHAAGYLRDGQITQKSVDHFKRVIDTKIKGAKTLISHLDFEKLDFINFFSSVAGRFGNQGQSDYAAANEILNKMAVKLNRQWPNKATAMNWGPWEGEGMVSDQVKKQFAEAGIYLLPRHTGAHMLNQEINLSSRSAEVVIFGADELEKRLPVLLEEDHHTILAFAELFKSVLSADNNQKVWELTVDQNAPYLNDHRIDGNAVLPASVAMEIMAQAAVAAKPGYRFGGIHDFKLTKGITIKTQDPVKLIITAQSSKNGIKNGIKNSVLIDVELKTSDMGNRCNYSSGILLLKTNGGQKQEIPSVTRYKHSQNFKHSLDQIYQVRLFQDGVFRGIKTVESYEMADIENNGIRGIIETSTPEKILGQPTKGNWLVDPITFDSAYQLALLWIQESYDSTASPGDMRNYIQYRPFNGGPIHCDVIVKLSGYPKLVMDFSFSDETGLLYAKAHDVTAILEKTLTKPASGHPESDEENVLEAN